MHGKLFPVLGLLAATLLLEAQTPALLSPHFVPAADPRIVVEGRYIATPAGRIRLGFPGVAIHCRYHGQALTMQLDSTSDEAFFDVTVDHNKPVCLRTKSGKHDYTIIQDSAPADHLVEIARRTESWQGACEVLGFDLGPGGRLLSAPPLPARKLLFIGDSITCGAMADYCPDDPPAGRTAHNTQWCDADATFCKALARHFHAQCHLVSYGGRGVIRDWQGLSTVCNAPQFYELALPDDPASAWDHSRYIPDAVVICLGGNDFNSGVPDETTFVTAYVQFVEKVRRDASQAWIFLLDCPMFKDEPGQLPKRSVLHAYLQEIVTKLNDAHVMLAPVSYYPGNPVDHHPTKADHQAIAAELEPVLGKALDWR